MAARTRYAPDRGLTVRMTATVLFAVILGGGFAVGSLFYSDKIALATAGGREVGPNDGDYARLLHGTVDRLCALADMKKPRVAIAENRLPNAFATGRNADHAVLCVTTGLLRSNLDDA